MTIYKETYTLIDGEWYLEENREMESAKWKYIVDSTPFFMALGGTEEYSHSTLDSGFVEKIISTSPDGLSRSIWTRVVDG